ncbi:MAG: hypothetical protein IJT59_07705 [Desulfovibrionaceae bacterium]|nr:hypothetical protein [Desulfovibrionaceae bacterium]
MFNDSNYESDPASDVTNQKVLKLLKKVEANQGFIGLLIISRKSWRFWWRQFLIGTFRGLGFSIAGTVILSAILGVIYYFLDYLIKIDIPYLTDLLKQIVAIIKNT